MVLGVVLVAATSAAVGLRRIVVSPLGVRNRKTTPNPRWIRAVIVTALILVVSLAFSILSAFESMAVFLAVLLGGFALGLGALNLVGPRTVRVIGNAKLKKTEAPADLLAARMILENPAQAWRQVSGIATTNFVSGVLVFPLAGIAVIVAPVSVGIIVLTLLAGVLAVRGAVALTASDELLIRGNRGGRSQVE